MHNVVCIHGSYLGMRVSCLCSWSECTGRHLQSVRRETYRPTAAWPWAQLITSEVSKFHKPTGIRTILFLVNNLKWEVILFIAHVIKGAEGE